jgi:hypothetical protein
MLEKIESFLFGNIPFSCGSNYSLEESVIRLRENTKRSVFSSIFIQKAAGKVSASKVRLQRVIPFFGNSFKPIFVGKFEERKGGIYLEGKFTTLMLSKIFTTVCFGFAFFWSVLAILQLANKFSTQADRLHIGLFLFPLAGFAFICIGVLLIKLCWKLSVKDIDFLEKVIVEALVKDS